MSVLIESAKSDAESLHKGQMYGDKPYTWHLSMTAGFAQSVGLNEDIIVACWLHDALEDTKASYSFLKGKYGEKIAEVVYAVTDELGRNRKERKEKTYPKIKANPDAVLVKLCDRVANLQAAIMDENEDMMAMYKKEHHEFANNLCPYDDWSNVDHVWEWYFKLIDDLHK